MNMRMNPIIKKDMKVTSRSMKMSWALLAYEGILAFIFIIAISMISYESSYRYQNTYSELIALFPWLAITQIGIVTLAIPVMTASSISGEKERQTFDIMMTTCLTPIAIVFGKVFSAVMEVMLFVVASIPIMALAFVLGGLSWWTLFLFLIVIFIFATLAGSIGVFCSSFSRKSIVSIILAFVAYFLVEFLSTVPVIWELIITRWDEPTISLLFLLLNPVVFLEEFFMLAMTGESLFSGDVIDADFISVLMHGPLWAILSGICMILLSALFMFLAAKRIDPLTGKYKMVKVKAQNVQSVQNVQNVQSMQNMQNTQNVVQNSQQ